MVAAAVVGSAVVGGVASSISAGKAASAQSKAAQNSINAQKGFYEDSKQALRPYMAAGEQASQKLSDLQGVPYYDQEGNLVQPEPGGIQNALASMPGYQFTLNQGLKSVQNSASARGLGISGAAQKGAAEYATGLANSQYGSYVTGLQNMMSTGAGAGGSLAGVATQTGSNIGAQYGNIGQAQAANYLSQGAAFGNAANSVPNAYFANKLIGGGSGNGAGNIDFYGGDQDYF